MLAVSNVTSTTFVPADVKYPGPQEDEEDAAEAGSRVIRDMVTFTTMTDDVDAAWFEGEDDDEGW